MNWKSKTLGLVGAAVLGLALVGPARAEPIASDEVNVSIADGLLSVAVTLNDDLAQVPYTAAVASGGLAIQATDGRVASTGWNVTARVDEFTGTSGTSGSFEADIDLLLASTDPNNQGVNGPRTTPAKLTSNETVNGLGEAKTVLTAPSSAPAGGATYRGDYAVTVYLASPPPGTYSSTIEVTIAAAGS